MNFAHRIRLAPLLILCVILNLTPACKLLGLEDESDAQLAALIAALVLSQKDSSSGTSCSSLSGTITGNVTACGTLSGVVTVESGATVTIGAGTTISAEAGSALIIKPGGLINAVGTASSPVVFTSSRSSGSRAPGDWGGISLVGSAPNSDSSSQAIEADSSVTYGGSSANSSSDSSGTMQYVRIEFTGETINSAAQNCLSLYSVGSGTTLDHIQCHMAADQAFVWFGGTANAKNLLGTGTADDDFYMTEGYSGTLQYLISHKYTSGEGVTASTTPYGLDLYGTPTGAAPTGNASYTNPTVRNYSLHGAGATGGYGIYARNGMSGNFQTGVLYNHAAGNIRCIDNSGGGSNTDPTMITRTENGKGDTTGAQCSSLTSTADLTSQPYTSAGNVSSNTAPDYTSTAGTSSCGSTSAGTFLTADTTCGGMTSTSGNWADGWTDYQPN